MEDNRKIDAVIAKLKAETGSDAWSAAAGYHALMAVDASATGVSFDPGRGLIVKSFVNDETGEVRTYYWQSVRTKLKITLKK